MRNRKIVVIDMRERRALQCPRRRMHPLASRRAIQKSKTSLDIISARRAWDSNEARRSVSRAPVRPSESKLRREPYFTPPARSGEYFIGAAANERAALPAPALARAEASRAITGPTSEA
jgi:hypothetical protein